VGKAVGNSGGALDVSRVSTTETQRAQRGKDARACGMPHPNRTPAGRYPVPKGAGLLVPVMLRSLFLCSLFLCSLFSVSLFSVSLFYVLCSMFYVLCSPPPSRLCVNPIVALLAASHLFLIGYTHGSAKMPVSVEASYRQNNLLHMAAGRMVHRAACVFKRFRVQLAHDPA
jgi:hypothetical protein